MDECLFRIFMLATVQESKYFIHEYNIISTKTWLLSLFKKAFCSNQLTAYFHVFLFKQIRLLKYETNLNKTSSQVLPFTETLKSI